MRPQAGPVGEWSVWTWALWAGAWAFVICLVIQFFFVGLDLFDAPSPVGLHRDFAYTYGWIAPALVLLAGLIRAPSAVLRGAVLLLVAFAVQTYLPLLADRAPWLASFHAVLAIGVLWLAVRLAQQVGDIPGGTGTSTR